MKNLDLEKKFNKKYEIFCKKNKRKYVKIIQI